MRINYKALIKKAAGEMDRIKNSTDPQDLTELFNQLADRSPLTLPVFARNMYVPDDILRSIPAKNPANRSLPGIVAQTLRKKEMAERKFREMEGIDSASRDVLRPEILQGVGDTLIEVEGPSAKITEFIDRYEDITGEEVTDEEDKYIGTVKNKRSYQIRIYFTAPDEVAQKMRDENPGILKRNTGRGAGPNGFHPEFAHEISSNDLAFKLFNKGLRLGKNNI